MGFDEETETNWEFIAKSILDPSCSFHFKKNLLLAKQERIIYEEIDSNLTKGISVSQKLKELSEIDPLAYFPGCARDRTYQKKFRYKLRRRLTKTMAPSGALNMMHRLRSQKNVFQLPAKQVSKQSSR